MTQTFFFTSAAIGLKELMDTLFVYYIFRHRLRFPALAVAVFAALTSILAKIGIEGVNSNLATAIRTLVVLLMVL